jgi:hypothetical protein
VPDKVSSEPGSDWLVRVRVRAKVREREREPVEARQVQPSQQVS